MTPNLLDFGEFLLRHARRLLAWGLAFALLGLGLALVVPKTYRATAAILPPEEDDAAVSLQSVRRSLGGLGGIGRLGSYFTQADVALAVLRSKSVHEEIVRKFDLQRLYHEKHLDDAVRDLRSRVSIKMDNEGAISVSVDDARPGLAADMANAFLEQLDHFNQQVRSFRARRSRQFLETRLAQEDSLLLVSEGRLEAYQKKHGTVVLSADARGSMEAAADLMSRKVRAEIDLELARQYASGTSDEVRRLSDEVRELNRQAGELPSTQLGGADLVRDVAMQEQVSTMLVLQLEDARIREAMDTPTIQLLDRATPPQRPIWPRKSIVMIFAFVLGVVACAIDLRFRRPRLPALRA